MPWSLRPAVPCDAELIATVLTEGFESYRSFAPPGWEPPDVQAELERLQAFLRNEEVWCLVAEDGGEIAGISVCRPEREGRPDMGWVGTLAVRKPWRRRGLGLALLLHSFRELRSRGRKRVGLGVDGENTTGAVRLYQRAGMRVARRRDTYERPSP